MYWSQHTILLGKGRSVGGIILFSCFPRRGWRQDSSILAWSQYASKNDAVYSPFDLYVLLYWLVKVIRAQLLSMKHKMGRFMGKPCKLKQKPILIRQIRWTVTDPSGRCLWGASVGRLQCIYYRISWRRRKEYSPVRQLKQTEHYGICNVFWPFVPCHNNIWNIGLLKAKMAQYLKMVLDNFNSQCEWLCSLPCCVSSFKQTLTLQI
jgi:hypothetical protein